MPLIPWVIGAGVLLAFGYAADKTGEAVNDTGSAALKFAAAAGVGYVIAKKAKVI